MELQESLGNYRKQGIGVAAITYDRPAALRDFATRRGIRYPLLSDESSRVIRAFGMLNENVPRDSFVYGVPHPGTFLLDAQGIVKAKYFESDYRDRFTAASILVKETGAPGELPGRSIKTEHLTLQASSSNRLLRGGMHFTLVLAVSLPRRMHVYAPGVQGGYKPVEWSLDVSPAFQELATSWPAYRNLHLKAIGETVPVFEGRFRVVRDLKLAQEKQIRPLTSAEGELEIRGRFRYQACDDKICYSPREIPLTWKLVIAKPDSERVPVPLRRPDPIPR